MGNRNYDKGAALENEVANRLSDNGYVAIRSAGSGAADRASCDVVAIDHEEILLIECKTYQEGSDDVVSDSDYRQMTILKDRSRVGADVNPQRRDVVTLLVLKEDGKFSPRYVQPFPASHQPSGDERLFSKFYK